MIRWLRALWNNFFRRNQLDDDLEDELHAYAELTAAEKIKAGTPTELAYRETRNEMGSVDQIRQGVRDIRVGVSLERLAQDVRYGARVFGKNRAFSLVAVVTLALGIGANTAIFSLIDGLLLRPLAVPHSDQLAVIRLDNMMPTGSGSFYFMGAPFFRSLESRHDIFQDVFAYSTVTLQVRGPSENKGIDGQYVSGEFFRALQSPAQLGRVLTLDDDRRGGNPAGLGVVISDRFWKTWFEGAPDVLGRRLQIGDTGFTVVGVMPKSFRGADPLARPDMFVPLAAEEIVDAPQSMISAGYRALWLQGMVRLKSNVSLDRANAALLPISLPIVRDDAPDAGFVQMAESNHFRFSVEPGSHGYTFLRGLFRKPLMTVFGMCGGILLLACLNLAGLLLARSAWRERELATRLALGASRGRLIQQLLVESMLIALVGTAAGLAVGQAVSRFLSVMMLGGRASMNSWLDTSFDAPAYAFAALVALAVTLLTGLLPALRATGVTLNEQLSSGRRIRGVALERRLLPRAMMTLQVALALILVIGAGLLNSSLLRLYRSGVGFDPHGVVNFAFDMDHQPLTGDPLVQVYRQIGDQLSRQPGVSVASFAQFIPLTFPAPFVRFSVPGQRPNDLAINMVGPGYFETMRIPLLEGREFRWEDDRGSGYKVILNQTAARVMFPGQDALGRHIIREMPNLRSPAAPPRTTAMEVIAVVGDAKYADLRTPAPPTAYSTITQNDTPARSLSAVLRLNGSPGPITDAARSITKRIAPTITAPIMTTLDNVVNDSISSERMMALLSVYFGVCALLVTAVGLYGTLAYSIARRTSEIGMRMALGASRARVLALVFRENAGIAFLGSITGLFAAHQVARLLASFLYQTPTDDLGVLAGSVATLFLIASGASLLPAWRAARIEPAKAIHHE